ncbi:uncharacterized protein FIBRA_09610 [Fibroporia radiculosa]|uniref:Uncharacterized protein n=1 Tax=Fibroporia radiculosa TaxID=599839 RepID=J7SD80_9APHY|nr:uncharacterized protein FIBRA_09610 [Fibroporia radiculosa]CCM07263.1 predicted protein [Fibroporia radiculosa]
MPRPPLAPELGAQTDSWWSCPPRRPLSGSGRRDARTASEMCPGAQTEVRRTRPFPVWLRDESMTSGVVARERCHANRCVDDPTRDDVDARGGDGIAASSRTVADARAALAWVGVARSSSVCMHYFTPTRRQSRRKGTQI